MRVLAALSGGVDSAVAAARLLGGGAEVIGVHLRTGVTSEGAGAGGGRSCCGADDARDARAVAARLGIPFYVVDVAEAFATVVEDFVEAYASGRTPNPCVLCNRDVKFGRLAQVGRALGCEAVATGHYARRAAGLPGRWRLLQARDAQKDQTYVLHALTQAQLARACFPLGAVTTKAAVRDEARAHGLPVAAKPDSQDLCFVPERDYRRFLRERAPQVLVPGDVVEAEGGRVVGRHDGTAGFTVGQRRGLPPLGASRYVSALDARRGRVLGARREALYARVERVGGVIWVDVAPPPAGRSFGVQARIRHGAPLARASLAVDEGGEVTVTFEEPVFAPSPGQALVAYVGDAVLCGGTILAGPDEFPPPSGSGAPE